MTISRDVLEIEAAMQTILDTILDHHTTTLTAAWATSWASVAGELEAALLELADGGDVPGWRIAQSRRAQEGMAAAGRALEDLAELTGTTISDDAARALGLGVDGELAMIGAQLPPGHDGVVRVDDAQISAMLGRTTQQITAVSWPISVETQAAIQSELARGMIVGDNPREAARRMMAATEGRFTGGLTRALTISRTETLDAMRTAQHAAEQVNAEALAGWMWGAHLDARTCFPAGTPVLIDGGAVPIEDVKPGDQVVTHTGRHRTVTETLARDYTGPMVTLTTEYGTITSTASHPLLVEREGELNWVEADYVLDGDSLLRYCDGRTNDVDHRGGEVAVQAGVWDTHHDESTGLHVQVLSSVPVLRPGVPVDAVNLEDRSDLREQEVDGVSPSGDRGLLLEGDAKRFEGAADVALGLGLSGVPPVALHGAELAPGGRDDSHVLPAGEAVDHDGRTAAHLRAVLEASLLGVEDASASCARQDLGVRELALTGAESTAPGSLGAGEIEGVPAPLAGSGGGGVLAVGGAVLPDSRPRRADGLAAPLALDGDPGASNLAPGGVRVLPLVLGVAGSPTELPGTFPHPSGGDREGASTLATGHFHTSIVSQSTTHIQGLTVFNIEVEDDHSYVANGYAVHNCMSCVGMHGTEWPLEEPGPIDHQNGRCARLPRTKSWAELGFPGIPEPDSGMVDAGEWFDGLTDQEQRAMLGKRGHEQWLAGNFPMDQWSTRRSTDGWRDSFAPAKPPKEA